MKAMRSREEKTLYPYVLEHKPGFFLSWVLYRLFKKVSLDENMKQKLKEMYRHGTVVYAAKYRGQLDYLLYHYSFRLARLPYPRIAFDLNMFMVLPLTYLAKVFISHLSFLLRTGRLPSPYRTGFYERAVEQGTTSLLFLVDPKGFSKQFVRAEKDQVEFLLETQKNMDRPIFLVPQLILYKKTPEKNYSNLGQILFGFKDNPGTIRKIVLFFRHSRRAFIDFGQPLNLKDYLASQSPARSLQEMASGIRQELIESIDMQKRVILGPIMKSKQEIKESVLRDKAIKQEIEETAQGNERKHKQLRKSAGKYFDEIAADYNMAYIQAFLMALNWFWKKIFEGVDVDMQGLARIREWARKGPLIYVPSHKSHIDYLILNHVLLNNHLHVPRIAAGANLLFWPMGHIFRQCGAFFIRRSLKGARLYAEVLARYIKALLEEGHPIQFFIEGGRSRNGKLMLPKTGFLSMLLQAYQEGFCKDLIFVPASITYDRILEEKSYLKELSGDHKEQESLRQVIRARRFLKMRYGKIYIRFNNPFSLTEYLSRKNQAVNGLHRELAIHLVKSINAVSPVTPLSVVAMGILANHRRGFHLSELAETVEILLNFIRKYGIPLAATLSDPEKAVKETLSLLTDWKVIDSLKDIEGEDEIFYYVEEDKKMELEYQKNSIIHFFIPHSLLAISLLSGKEEVKKLDSIVADYAFLKYLFKSEFVFDEQEDLPENVTSFIEYFQEAGFLSRSEEDGGYKITKLGFDKLPIWAGLAKTFLESYWIAVKAISQQKSKAVKDDNLVKHMMYLGKRFHRLGIIDHIGALSELTFKNAISHIHEHIFNPHENTEETSSRSLERLSQLGQRLYELSHYGA
jgi:glycerol-3-phosphate O-acyltransferase